MPVPRYSAVLMIIAVTALAACQQQPAAAPGAPASAGASAPVIPPAAPATLPAPADSAPLPGDQATTARYKIDITLPRLGATDGPLATAIRTTADNAKREFLQALPDPVKLPEFAHRQLTLFLTFKVVATTPAFVSVREEGGSDTGGAHPIPIQAAFVYDRASRRLVTLDDLFADPDGARKALANFAHDTLLKKFMAAAPTPSEGSPEALREWRANTLQMLNDGTKPTTVNYSLFVVQAGADANAASPGITLVFPPYQVAPYVNGTQLVDVPASLFAKFLKPVYGRDFAAP